MNRAEFMEKLRIYLGSLPENEREEAIEFYEGYFDDAGEENEQDVIKALVSPEKVAQTIIEGYCDEHGEKGEFTENGFSGYGEATKDEVGHYQSKRGKSKLNLGNGGLILLLIAAVFALPILGPILIGIVSTIFGILVAAGTILFAAIIVGIALIVVGVVAMVGTFGFVLIKPSTALITFGVGLLLLGLGILLVLLGVWIVSKVLPPLVRWAVSIVQNLFGKLFSRKEQ